MADLTPLVPEDDGTTSLYFLWVNDGADTEAWQATDDDPDSPNTADYIHNGVGDDSDGYLLLTSVDTDFASMDTLAIRGYFTSNGTRSDDNIIYYAQIFASDEATAYTDEVELARWDSGGAETGIQSATFTLNGTGEAASESDWNGARLHIRIDCQQSKNWDGIQLRLCAVEVTGTYTPEAGGVSVTPTPVAAVGATVAPTVIAGSITISPTEVTTVAGVVDPTAIAGSISITPTPVAGVATTVDPTAIAGSISLTPAAVGATVATEAPTIIMGSISLSPDPAAAVGATVDPTVQTGGGGETVSPAAVEAVAAVVAPTVIMGSISITPGAVAAVASSLVGAVIHGSLNLQVGEVSAIGVTVDPIIIQGNVIISPGAVAAIAAIVQPSVIAGEEPEEPESAGIFVRHRGGWRLIRKI